MKALQGTQILLLVLALTCCHQVNGQRVVPGVNPQHYQQQGQYQQMPQQGMHPQQQQQQQYQQPPVHAPGVAPQHYQQMQYQQVPQQQQQQQQFQQVPQQQVPQHHQQQQQIPQHQQQQQMPQQPQVPQQQQPHHGHHPPHGQPQQVLNTANIDQERAHIQEHMQVPIDTSKMSEAELQFHYFKMHDSDNNNKLDGCELIKSLIHWHADDHDKDGKEEKKEKEEAGTGERKGAVYTDQGLADVIDYVLDSMDSNKDGFVDYAEYRKGEENHNKSENKSK